ncbi:hypothetical protein HK104_007092, partial [Borealophlyctis nickersoniae]
ARRWVRLESNLALLESALAHEKKMREMEIARVEAKIKRQIAESLLELGWDANYKKLQGERMDV